MMAYLTNFITRQILNKKKSILPGFGFCYFYTILYLSLIVLIPLIYMIWGIKSLEYGEFLNIVASKRVMHAYKLTFSSALIAALINSIFGVILAWVLVRYDFAGKRWLDALIDLPFALPTAVAGIALSAIYASDGMVGKFLAQFGIKLVFNQAGIIIALIFVGIPFVVRTIEPLLVDMDPEIEEAAASLGASRNYVFRKLILPYILRAMLTGFAMAFARGLGEYGAVIFIAGNIPNISEIVPLLIIIKLEQFDYQGATAIAFVMLSSSFILLFIINLIQNYVKKSLGYQT